MAKSTLSRAFFEIIDSLNKIAPSIIKWPTIPEMEASKSAFRRRCGLPNIIGAIDGTYVAMKAPKDQISSYTNRKMFTAMTLQAICNHDMKYIDCFVGYPSSVHDLRIFKNSDIFERVQQKHSSQ